MLLLFSEGCQRGFPASAGGCLHPRFGVGETLLLQKVGDLAESLGRRGLILIVLVLSKHLLSWGVFTVHSLSPGCVEPGNR